jgi:hypothetical protein
MRKLLAFIGIILLSAFTANAQLTVNQSIVTKSSYKVGDTIQVKYTVNRGSTTPRYFWLRYQYNNKALTYVSTTWSQGTSVQTYYTGWNNYKFTENSSADATSLYGQYQSSNWAYTANSDWNVGQLTVQRTDASIDGDIATQKYILKDLVDYTDIHKLDLSYAVNTASTNISPITTTTGKVSLGTVTGATSQFKVRVLYPSGYTIADHSIQLMPLLSDGVSINSAGTPIATKALDSNGEVTFTTEVKVGDIFGVMVTPASQKSWMDNVVTVADAYKAFLGVTSVGLDGTSNYFTYPVRDQRIGNVSKDDGTGTSTFNETDAYYLFSYIMGIDMSSKAYIPAAAATSFRFESALLNQNWIDGTNKNKVTITAPLQTVDMVYAWAGDLDYSHSSSPTEIASRITSGNISTGMNTVTYLKSSPITTMSYTPPVLENVKLSVASKLENGKVILTTTLTRADLAGLEVIMNYDNAKLTLDNVLFDSGNTITNFSTHENGRLTFGSIDQLKSARIKVGTPYTLIFTPKTTLTNTAGLFYFILSDAIDSTGKKVNLIVE